MDSNKPLSELYGEIGHAWAQAEYIASLKEEGRSGFLSRKMQEYLSFHTTMAVNKAEMSVKASKEWADYIEEMVEARREASKLKIQLEQIKMAHMDQQSEQANERVQARL